MTQTKRSISYVSINTSVIKHLNVTALKRRGCERRYRRRFLPNIIDSSGYEDGF